MASRSLEQRGIGFRRLGRARLHGYRLAFRRRSIRTNSGVADIVPEPGAEVWGVVYELTDDDAAELDRKEGRPWAYDRREIRITLGDARETNAFTYVVSRPEPHEVVPSPDYVELMVEGADEVGLPATYIDTLKSLHARARDDGG